jgi:hypothetical protein
VSAAGVGKIGDGFEERLGRFVHRTNLYSESAIRVASW